MTIRNAPGDLHLGHSYLLGYGGSAYDLNYPPYKVLCPLPETLNHVRSPETTQGSGSESDSVASPDEEPHLSRIWREYAIRQRQPMEDSSEDSSGPDDGASSSTDAGELPFWEVPVPTA